MQAAIIYQHATTEADVRIAATLDIELHREFIRWLVRILPTAIWPGPTSD